MARIPTHRLIKAAQQYSDSDLSEAIGALTAMRDERAKPKVEVEATPVEPEQKQEITPVIVKKAKAKPNRAERRQQMQKQNKTKIQRTPDAGELRTKLAAVIARNESLVQTNLGMARQLEIQANTIRELRAKADGQVIRHDNQVSLPVAS